MSKDGSLNKDLREILPLDSFDSNRLMGYIFMREIRPVPECMILLLSTDVEPVRINSPSSCR